MTPGRERERGTLNDIVSGNMNVSSGHAPIRQKTRVICATKLNSVCPEIMLDPLIVWRDIDLIRAYIRARLGSS